MTITKANRYIKSASLIIIGRNPLNRPNKSVAGFTSNKCGVDFKTLFLRRSSRSRFLSNGLVFPGGTLDAKADYSLRWKNIFTTHGIGYFSTNIKIK